MFLPTAVLAVMKSVCLQGFPWPAIFSADTLNVYSRPSMRPVQVYWVALTTDSLAFTHRRLFLSFFSMQNPVMGDPPSLLGRSQDKMTKSLLILLIWRFRGSLGGSGNKKNIPGVNSVVPCTQCMDERVSSASDTHQMDVWRSSWLSRWAQRCQICSRHGPGMRILCWELAWSF